MAFGVPQQTTPKMAEGGPPPSAGGAAKPPGAPGAPGQTPFGNSQASQATPNAGYEAVAKQRIGVIANQIQDLLKLVGATGEMGQKLVKVLNDLVKMVPAGTTSPASEKNMLDQAQMRNTQNMATAQQLKQRMQPPGGAPQGGGAQPPAGMGA